MAIKKWVVVAVKHCGMIDKDVEFKEQRVYPSNDNLWMHGMGHQVRACTCSAAVDCNMAGVPCRWAYNSPYIARF